MVKRAIIFIVLLAWCGALLAGRVWRSGHLTYGFLAWNLVLAVVPAVAAALVVKTRATAARLFWLIVWLLFLPNAPYIVTDFVHLVTFVYGVCFALGYAALHVIGTTTMRSR